MAEFDDLVQKIQTCTLCSLSEKRTNAVPGEGDRAADIMFIGEGPGYYEDRDGRPFVGPAGQLLDEMLASIRLVRGKPRRWRNLMVYPMYHPAAALHNPRLRPAIETDFGRLPSLIDEVNRMPEEKEDGQAEQLSLFE